MNLPEDHKTQSLQHVRFEDMPVEHLNPKIDRQFVSGERSMLARLVLRTGVIVPTHSHDNEQITYILQGALKFIVEEKEIVVRAGEVLVIPANTPHSAEALEDTIDVDVFCPPRADWISGADAYLRK